MKEITIPKLAESGQDYKGFSVTKAQIKDYFKQNSKAPSIKQQLIMRAFEITDETKLLCDMKEVAILYSEDQTGIYLTCFNKIDDELVVTMPLSVMNLEKAYRAYCVLTSEEIGIINDLLRLCIPKHGVLLVKLIED